MNYNNFRSAEWYHSLPLNERLSSLPSEDLRGEYNINLAQKKLQKWQSQPPFNDHNLFAKCLELENISEADFLYILGESVESLKRRFSKVPNWLTKLEQAFSGDNKQQIFIEKDLEEEVSLFGFLYTVEPLLSQAIEQLKQELNSLTQQEFPFDPKTIQSILSMNLPERLIEMLSRTMVLELNVARLQGILKEETSSDRFKHFIKRLKQPEITLALFQEYPVLARQLTIYIDQWLDYSLEFIHHLCQDWELICSTFSPDKNPGVLIDLQGGAGDSHKNGRSVLIAEFESGLKLVYKPQNLEIYTHFGQLLEWFNERSQNITFRSLKVLNFDSHGWVEFIQSQGCTTVEEIERFYQRQGGYLALLYTLEATDFHCENLIACGEHPILIDLEALFHPYFFESDSKTSVNLAGDKIAYSVLRVGLLPQKLWGNDESAGVDISGLVASPGQLTPQPVPTWEGTGTDEMKLTRKQVEISVGENRPLLNENEVNVLDYTEAIVLGFTEIYQLLLKHREELLTINSPLMNFANDEVRVVLRPTDTYARMIWDSFHPDLLRNALDRDRFFDYLWNDIKYRPELEKVVIAEQQDLWNNDVPIFTTYPNSCHLWTSTKQLIPNFFRQSGLDTVRQRLNKLNESDQLRQIWFINASLATLVMGVESFKNTQKQKQQNEQLLSEIIIEPKEVYQQLINNACQIADHLDTLALKGEDDATWLGLNLVGDKNWSVLPLGIDLYDGLSGVILFLAYLGAITQESRYTKLAEAAFKSIKREISQEYLINSIGGFSGLGGIIYTLSHLGILWKQPNLLSDAEVLIDKVLPLIDTDEGLDIIAGAAGCIGGLMSLYHCKPSNKVIDAARKCGDRLIIQAKPMQQGIGWVLKDMGENPLSGFSHGVAGIAWSLLELYRVTGEQRYYDIAIQGITYEKILFSPQLNNWLDLRDFTTQAQPNQHICMTAWCHGAPGIGLARLQSLCYLDNLATRTEINTAIKTTLEQGFGSNHSLCHGDLGNLELILQASLILNDSNCQNKLNHHTQKILASIHQQGWVCGVPLGVETPGLMTGLAGIGYGLLRLAEPHRIPSVLVLEHPYL